MLYSAAIRDILLEIAVTRPGLYSAHWTTEIEIEWKTALARNRPDIPVERLNRLLLLMRHAVPTYQVVGHEPLIRDLVLPDPDDRHVLAAAIHAEADVIVTGNLRDFPQEILAPHDIVAMAPNTFLTTLVQHDAYAVASAAFQVHHRINLRRPVEMADWCERLARHGLPIIGLILQHPSLSGRG